MKITKDAILKSLSLQTVALKPTQKKISLPIVYRIFKKMSNGIKFSPIKVCEGLIIDGHHRYIGSILAKYNIDSVPSYKSMATLAYDWSDVEFVNEEWDTPAKIRMLNELDAKFNEIAIEKLIKIIE